MTADRLTPQREAEIAVWRKRIADLLWWSVPGSTDAEAKATTADLLDKLIAAVRAESAAELAAVRAERDEARARTLREAAAMAEDFASGPIEEIALGQFATHLRKRASAESGR